MKAAVVGIAGPTLRAEEAAMFAAFPPAGVILFARNIVDPPQLAALAEAIRAACPGAGVLVDQEGGRVARLRPPHWRAHPTAAAHGALHGRDRPAALRAAWLTGALIGCDCADFDVVCAPVLDVAAPGADAVVVGDRSFSNDPDDVAALGGAFAAGLLAAGVIPVIKHAPGHGRATVDSHHALPVVDAADLAADIAPFAANRDLPWAMTAHIVYTALDPDRPATLSPRVIAEVIRGRIGFDGVLVSDDLAMSALQGPPEARALAALAAGCDLAAWCPGDLVGNRAVLEAVPEVTQAAQVRLARARAAAKAARQALDAAALAAERDRIFA